MDYGKCPDIPPGLTRHLCYPDDLQVSAQWDWDQAMAQRPAAPDAQAAADAELEACCEWLAQQAYCYHKDLIPALRAARRPALSARNAAIKALRNRLKTEIWRENRNAMELALRVLEGGNQ